MSKLMVLALCTALLVHGYFYLRYETVHPCRAAIIRAVEDHEPLFTVSARALLGEAMSDRALMVASKAIESERGYPYCYRVALMGSPGKGQRKP
jgi:hypothetical protein